MEVLLLSFQRSGQTLSRVLFAFLGFPFSDKYSQASNVQRRGEKEIMT